MPGDTRERILQVAAELFVEQGYEATSLRQIAEQLGFTKAALYYHFQSKDQIFAALLEPAERLLQELLERLEAADGVEGWASTLEWVIGQIFENLELFKLLERNRASVEALSVTFESMHDHHAMHERVEAAVLAKTPHRREQIRMVAALGAVTGFDDWAPRLLVEVPPAELKAELVAAVRDILALPRARRPRAVAAVL